MMRKIWNFITSILLILYILVVALLFLPQAAGLKPMYVLSGSMEPTYHVGSLIYIKPGNADKLEVSRPVTYTMGNSDVVVTHRVIKIDKEKRMFYTKGDANLSEDSGATSFDHIIGYPLLSIPYLGYVAAFASKTAGKIILVTGLAILLIMSYLFDFLTKRGGKSEKN
ncbi:signal peptidase I [Anaerosacchariphilus polymeriproducens]|uniref:Signal peptidase I n=1 Tax=Anaerosacchariphilus polymeriproducens TaxID=1812858 RepID=A0A371B008_9FIRM|nr:signal peptidase I [Anaerosacchariphilus polymeriproducens]RDU25165.1 signal peptidase I [Anaerosacchariphilus polymeriproducens]